MENFSNDENGSISAFIYSLSGLSPERRIVFFTPLNSQNFNLKRLKLVEKREGCLLRIVSSPPLYFEFRRINYMEENKMEENQTNSQHHFCLKTFSIIIITKIIRWIFLTRKQTLFLAIITLLALFLILQDSKGKITQQKYFIQRKFGISTFSFRQADGYK